MNPLIKASFKQLSLLKAAPQDQDAIRAWGESVSQIVHHVGERRFQLAVQRCIDTQIYFPMPATLKDLIPPALSVQDEEARRCPDCGGSGFAIKKRPHPWAEKAGQFETYAERCAHTGLETQSGVAI